MNQFFNRASTNRSNRRGKQRGQGMTEYIVVTALIGVAAISVFMLFGNTARNQVAGMSRELSGQNGGTEITAAQNSANAAATQANTSRSLATYNNQVGGGAAPAGGGGGGGGGGGNP